MNSMPVTNQIRGVYATANKKNVMHQLTGMQNGLFSSEILGNVQSLQFWTQTTNINLRGSHAMKKFEKNIRNYVREVYFDFKLCEN